MSDTLYYLISALLSLGVLYGIRLMSQVRTAALGNRVSALCMLAAIVITLYRTQLGDSLVYIIIGLLAGTLISIFMTIKVRMIQMPQMVGLLNGLGGLSSALAALLTLALKRPLGGFEVTTSGLALAVGALTFSGSMVAALKLHGKLSQKPVVYPGHRWLSAFAALVMLALIVLLPLTALSRALALGLLTVAAGLLFGWLFAIRVGGADMPITISLLNSTSGVAAAIAGMALGDILLVAVGGIVGSSGLLLTQIMCRAMNRSLPQVLFGGAAQPQARPEASAAPPAVETAPEVAQAEAPAQEQAVPQDAGPSQEDLPAWLTQAQSVIIIPGYGMAVSQAQEKVKQLLDRLQSAGKKVRFAIHPVAGRMPGHMNVLLAEVDIDYELLCEMDDINPDFAGTDLAIIIGANDVVNPAANTAQGTPIYGMPILDAAQAGRLIICNFDTQPGYAGVDNPLYQPQAKVMLLLGDAKDSLDTMLASL
ncbi:MAG: NAD(P)(+) transhydrogenase (Re/Si-specific) subunit beta [Clostridiales bacterium]|nr:NAD(P)(+) transhydrogenase (Re/Si-specific) subunit beta [Clostridiales bacterium]